MALTTLAVTLAGLPIVASAFAGAAAWGTRGAAIGPLAVVALYWGAWARLRR